VGLKGKAGGEFPIMVAVSPPCLLTHRVLAGAGKDLKGSVFLEALAEREEANRNGKMTVRWLEGLKGWS
jgi:hypothetical protein